ncbi:MAG: hypothetical protein ACI83W_002617 [Marinoscillum sp.]|jgi:hypothetical protein
MKKAVYCLFFFPFILSAQINESDTFNVKASLALTGFWQGGNVETLIFRGRQDLSVRPWKKWVFKTENSYVYQAFGGQKADEDILSLNFLYFNPERKIYPLALGFVSTNYRRAIALRYLFGAGATFQLVNKKEQWLKLSLTCEYEETNFSQTTFNQTEYNGQESINTFRGTIWVNGKYNLFDKKMILTHEIYLQPSISQSNNSRWQADIGLELPIWKFLNFKINYRHTFESLVIKSQKQVDKFLTFGFTLKSF